MRLIGEWLDRSFIGNILPTVAVRHFSDLVAHKRKEADTLGTASAILGTIEPSVFYLDVGLSVATSSRSIADGKDKDTPSNDSHRCFRWYTRRSERVTPKRDAVDRGGLTT